MSSLEQLALERIGLYVPKEGYHLAFSGGKDSVVLYDLAVRAGVPFDAHYNITGVDPPELVYFIREHYPSVIHDAPLLSLPRLLEKKGAPTRQHRFCCEYLKEHGGEGRWVLTGIRWEESVRRRGRMMVESCKLSPGRFYLHPIIEWSEPQVWSYIRKRGLSYCALYDEGFNRLGCVLCPMQTPRDRERQIARWPKLVEVWRRGLLRYYKRGTPGVQRFPTFADFWGWWLSRKSVKDWEKDWEEEKLSPPLFS